METKRKNSVYADGFAGGLETAMGLLMIKDAGEACRAALDKVIEVVGLEKGYVFSVDYDEEYGGDIGLAEICARLRGGTPFVAEEYEISQSFLRSVIRRRGEIVFYSENPVDKADPSESIVKYRLKTVLCMPLVNSAGRIRGIVYSDSHTITTAHLEICLPALRKLSKLLAYRLMTLGAPWFC